MCEGNIGEAVEHGEKLCDEVKTVREFTYLGDWLSADGGCETAAITGCVWVMCLRLTQLIHRHLMTS